MKILTHKQEICTGCRAFGARRDWRLAGASVRDFARREAVGPNFPGRERGARRGIRAGQAGLHGWYDRRGTGD